MDSHYFLAIPLPAESKQMIARWKEGAKEHLIFKKWVHEEDYHITLFFLGAVSAEQLNGLSEKMRRIAEEASSFTIPAGETGYFGKPDQPKIFWAGAKAVPMLVDIQRKIMAGCVEHGFSAEKREYRPHITLARKWEGTDSFQKEVKKVPSLHAFEWTVDHFVLFKTHLNKDPKYEMVEKFTFGDVSY
ncbi:RNA 2',3'-cyclic phosphodiesterase [Salibacterium salarium]|nr:RNA 2',3'-cyclic phosphodiesterase [Salibacterium salarium]